MHVQQRASPEADTAHFLAVPHGSLLLRSMCCIACLASQYPSADAQCMQASRCCPASGGKTGQGCIPDPGANVDHSQLSPVNARALCYTQVAKQV